jgi:hypothetical protein
MGWDGMGWTEVRLRIDSWRALVNTLMYLQVDKNLGNFLSSYTTDSFPERA